MRSSPADMNWRQTGAAAMPVSPVILVTAMWLLASIVLLVVFRKDIATLAFMDPDDAMRLQQVRDWLGGQGWFDISQHRVNPPAGGPMHWSRIVDLPIAGMIMLMRPIMGQPSAELIACAIVPPLLMGALTLVLFHIARRLSGDGFALFCVALLLTTPTILIQFPPLRIDHHGWQIVMGAIALAGALDIKPLRGGVSAGLAIAIWLVISAEALPYAALFGGVFILMQLHDVHDRVRLQGYAVSLALGALILLCLTRGIGAVFISQCDALSAIYVWPLAFFAVSLLASYRLFGSDNVKRRLLVPAIGAILAAGVMLATGTSCLTGGPFQHLTPLAHEYWYAKVMEGRPIWEQELSLIGVIALPPLVGLAATLAAARSAPTPKASRLWFITTLLLAGAIVMAMMVMRAMMLSHLFALPGIAWLTLRLAWRIQTWSLAVLRVSASVALVLLTPVGLASISVLAVAPMEPPHKVKVQCQAPALLASLRKLPPSVIFAPLDIGPQILILTRHSVVGTGHHRNVVGINAVTHAFLSSPDDAYADIMAVNGGRGADYLAACPGMNEMLLYSAGNPNGLAARLARGEVPGWLRPVPTQGALKLYRVLPGSKVSAAPFMQ